MNFLVAYLSALANILILIFLIWSWTKVSTHHEEQIKFALKLLSSHEELSTRLQSMESKNKTSADKEKGFINQLLRVFGSKNLKISDESAQEVVLGDAEQEFINIMRIVANGNQTCPNQSRIGGVGINRDLEEGEAVSNFFSFIVLAAGFTVLFRMAYSEFIAFHCMKDAEEAERLNGRRYHSVSIGEFIKYRSHNLPTCVKRLD